MVDGDCVDTGVFGSSTGCWVRRLDEEGKGCAICKSGWSMNKEY